MGVCWCKDKVGNDSDPYTPSPGIHESPASDVSSRQPKPVDQKVINHLILEMLTLIATFVDNSESPVSLVKLHVIADTEEGWIQVVVSMVEVIPLEDPFGPSVITIMLDDCPLPSKETVLKLAQRLNLTRERAWTSDANVRVERNICIALGGIAEKLAGPNSAAVLTGDILDYLVTFMETRREPDIVLFALIALEKFAQTTENKLRIREKLEALTPHPLLELEEYAESDDLRWRQVGFCAQWALDNLFVVEGRTLSYLTADMSDVNAILNTRDVSEYLKISSGGLEARCDSYSFESVRCTQQVDSGCWYYECTIVTPGVMQIGWATKNSHFLNYDGYGIGDDLYSISYDGCRRLTWYKARPTPVAAAPVWAAGDVLGCLMHVERRQVVFSLNGVRLPTYSQIFETTRDGFFAAASFMAFQQCMFNFGDRPFRFPPTDRHYNTFNEFGKLTEDQKKVIPRRLVLQELRFSSVREDSCTLCFDDLASCVLVPCGHRGFCSVCTSQLRECPMCRSSILNVTTDEKRRLPADRTGPNPAPSRA